MGDLFIRMDSMISIYRTQQDRVNEQCVESTKLKQLGKWTKTYKTNKTLNLLLVKAPIQDLKNENQKSPKRLAIYWIKANSYPWINRLSESHSQKPFQNSLFADVTPS